VSIRFAAPLLALLLVACSGGDNSTAQTAAQAPAGNATARSQDGAAASAPAAQQARSGEQTASAGVSSDSAPVVEFEVDMEELAARAAAASRFEANQHYRRLSPAQPISTDTGQIEVAEIFMYSCPGCYAFEPHITRWKERKADYINLVRIPAMFHRVAIVHAQAYYTAEVLGITEEIHSAFFQEFHANNNMLDSESSLRRFFGRFGVSEEDFNSAWNSFTVQFRMERARELAGRYTIGETPTVVVHGKYVITGAMAGSYDTWFEIIDGLAAREMLAASE
jgi:protein dithiol oxidoreductase (disulfide-forming)